MKKCTKCEVEKELNEFHNSNSPKRREDGKDNQCKLCRNTYKKLPDYRANLI
jgi:hypothetical protein